VTWYCVLNDLIGGWAVGNVDKPMHQYGAPGDYVLADMMDEEPAQIVAEVLNERGYLPPALRAAAGAGSGEGA
jgi:hypothetical protein